MMTQEERELRRKKEAEEHKKFKQKFYEELDIVNNPKKELLFEKAWGLGHAYGENEVLSYGMDLVDLIK